MTTELEKLKMTAGQGDADSQYKLGCAYSIGDGIEQNYDKAEEWFRMAADQGHAGARFNLALMHRSPQDYTAVSKSKKSDRVAKCSVTMPEWLHKEIAHYCVDHSISMSGFIVDVLVSDPRIKKNTES